MKTYALGVVCALGTWVLHAQAATVVLQSFETGDFTGWQTLGNATVVSDQPTDGIFNAKIINSAAGSLQRDAVMAFIDGSLPTNGVGSFSVGSAIKTTVTVGAGEALQFDWRMDSGEFHSWPNNFPDFVFFTIDGLTRTLYTVPTMYYPNISTPPGATDQFTTKLLVNPGIHTIAFGSMQTFDNYVDTTLWIDRLATTTDLTGAQPVPLPAAAYTALPLLGLMGLAVRRRRVL